MAEKVDLHHCTNGTQSKTDFPS